MFLHVYYSFTVRAGTADSEIHHVVDVGLQKKYIAEYVPCKSEVFPLKFREDFGLKIPGTYSVANF